MPEPDNLIFNEVKRDFKPVMGFIKSTKIYKGEENIFDPVIGDFAKYMIPRAEIGLYEELNRQTRKLIFEMISEALSIKIDQISDLDFDTDPRDPRMTVLYLLLADETEIIIPLIDRFATMEE